MSAPTATIQLYAVSGKPMVAADWLMSIADGATIDLSKLPAKYAIIADTTPALVASVAFSYDGAPHTETTSPYALAGDLNKVLNPMTITVGSHTLSVVAKSSAGNGTTTINFTAVASVPPVPVPNPTPSPTPTTSQPLATNTGPVAGTVFKTVPGFTAKSNTTYTGLHVNGTVNAQNTKGVTFINCEIDGGRTANGNGAYYNVNCSGASGLTIKNCELKNAQAAAVYGDGYTAIGNFVHNSGGDAFKCGSNCLVEGNYVTAIGWLDPKAHADGMQMVNGSNVQVIGNNFDTVADAKAQTKCNSLTMLGDGAGTTISNVLIKGNWSKGGEYTINVDAGGTVTNLQIIGNIISKSSKPQYGLLATHSHTGIVVSGNVWDDGTPITK